MAATLRASGFITTVEPNDGHVENAAASILQDHAVEENWGAGVNSPEDSGRVIERRAAHTLPAATAVPPSIQGVG